MAGQNVTDPTVISTQLKLPSAVSVNDTDSDNEICIVPLIDSVNDTVSDSSLSFCLVMISASATDSDS